MSKYTLAKYSVRDDDISYFSEAKDIEKYYKKLTTISKPTMCVIPAAGEIYHQILLQEDSLVGRNAKLQFVREISKHGLQNKKQFPVSQNTDLVALIRGLLKDGLIEIAMHGVTHNQTQTGFECESTKGVKEILERGIDILEDAFNVEIKWFSPPNNSINSHWYKEIDRMGLNVVHSLGPLPWEVPKYLSAYSTSIKIALNALWAGRRSRLNQPLCIGSKFLLQSLPLGPGVNLNETIDFIENAAMRKDRSLVFATHSYGFGKYPETWDALIAAIEASRQKGMQAAFLNEQLSI